MAGSNRSSILNCFEETPYWEHGGKGDISVILSSTKNIFKKYEALGGGGRGSMRKKGGHL